jgi:hypothetical protein
MGDNDKHKHRDNELAGGRTGTARLTSSRTAGDVVKGVPNVRKKRN